MSRNFIALACVGFVSVPGVLGINQIIMTAPGVSNGVSGSQGGEIPAASVSIASTLPGWINAPGAQFQFFPDHYTQNDFSARVPFETRVLSGSTVTFICNNDDGKDCSVVAFYYSCHPCESATGNNGMALTAMGFERTRCAPTFTTGVAGGIQHRMVGYVKSIPNGQVEVLTVDGDLDFAVFALGTGAGVTCGDFVTAEQCEAPEVNNFCKFTYGECRIASCVSVGPSFGAGCDPLTCARIELPYP